MCPEQLIPTIECAVDVANPSQVPRLVRAREQLERVLKGAHLPGLESVLLLQHAGILHQVPHMYHSATHIHQGIAGILDGTAEVVDLADVLDANQVNAHRRDGQSDYDV